jgi:hypothetical protein
MPLNRQKRQGEKSWHDFILGVPKLFVIGTERDLDRIAE